MWNRFLNWSIPSNTDTHVACMFVELGALIYVCSISPFESFGVDCLHRTSAVGRRLRKYSSTTATTTKRGHVFPRFPRCARCGIHHARCIAAYPCPEVCVSLTCTPGRHSFLIIASARMQIHAGTMKSSLSQNPNSSVDGLPLISGCNWSNLQSISSVSVFWVGESAFVRLDDEPQLNKTCFGYD